MSLVIDFDEVLRAYRELVRSGRTPTIGLVAAKLGVKPEELYEELKKMERRGLVRLILPVTEIRIEIPRLVVSGARVASSSEQRPFHFATRVLYTFSRNLTLIPVTTVFVEETGKPVIYWRTADGKRRAIAISRANYYRFLEIGQRMKVLPILFVEDGKWNIVYPTKEVILDMLRQYQPELLDLSRADRVYINEPEIKFVVAKGGRKFAVTWSGEVKPLGEADSPKPYVEARAFYYVINAVKNGKTYTLLATPVVPMTPSEARNALAVVIGEAITKKTGKPVKVALLVPRTWYESIKDLIVAELI